LRLHSGSCSGAFDFEDVGVGAVFIKIRGRRSKGSCVRSRGFEGEIWN
jgi:hypothetical protein